MAIPEEQRLRLLHVAVRLQNAVLCSGERIFERYRTFAQGAGFTAEAERLDARAIFLDQIEETGKDGLRRDARPDDVALIQFSSGSTSAPKGVQLTHRNITANLDGVVDSVGFSPSDATLSWMPLTHDMGLIGFHLTALSLGLDQYLMPPSSAVRGSLWKKKGVGKAGDGVGLAQLRLSALPASVRSCEVRGRRALDGAHRHERRQPISPDLCDEFNAALAPCGLKASSMFPAYGLAEATVAVTFPPLGRGIEVVAVDRESLAIGAPARIVDARWTRRRCGS